MPIELPTLRLWTMSDLHLEQVKYPEEFAPARPDFDVLVSAGDIWRGNLKDSFRTLRRLAGKQPVIAVLGNHEHWNGEITETIERAREIAPEHGVTLLENDVIDYAGVRFFGCTLWSDGTMFPRRPVPEAATGEQIAFAGDYVGLVTLKDVWAIHAQSRAALEAAMLGKPAGAPMVVLTHHAPVVDCLPDPHLHGWAAGNSTSDLGGWTDTGIADVWIHGHIHVTQELSRPNGTRIICNAAGGGFTNLDFDESLVVGIAVRDVL